MKATFENSVSVLVMAYMNDTLVHRRCSACAVGNLIADAIGDRPRGHLSFKSGHPVRWQEVFMTSDMNQLIEPCNYHGEARRQIDSTGYTWQQLARVEYAFETAQGAPKQMPFGEPGYEAALVEDTWMFNGLMAVVEVLADIHQVDLSVKEQAIGQFKEVQLAKA